MLEILLGVVALTIVATLGVGIAVAVLRERGRTFTPSGHWPFSLRRPLTEPEQVLYHRLCKALPDHMVLAQVGLSRFIAVRRGHDARSWYDRIHRMSIDFLVCAKDATIIAAIELDDASHQSADHAEVDLGKEKALRAAGVRLLRWNVKAMPDDDTLRSAIASLALPQQPAPRPADPDTKTFRTA